MSFQFWQKDSVTLSKEKLKKGLINQSFMGQVTKAIKGDEDKNNAPVFDGNNLSAPINQK